MPEPAVIFLIASNLVIAVAVHLFPKSFQEILRNFENISKIIKKMCAPQAFVKE